jgi:hypothetical protein
MKSLGVYSINNIIGFSYYFLVFLPARVDANDPHLIKSALQQNMDVGCAGLCLSQGRSKAMVSTQ